MNQIPAQFHNYAGGRHVNMPFCDNKRGTFLVSTAHFCTEKHIIIIICNFLVIFFVFSLAF